MTRISLSAPDTGEVEAKYVAEAISSGWVAPAGPDLTAFESEVAARVGVDRAVALSSGTAAIHLGLLTLGVRPGDVVLTSTMTFAATANAITYLGAAPYFVDSHRDTGNVDVALMRQAAEDVRATGRRIGALLPVPLLVDAAEAVGASFNGRAAGSFGHASVFSFNGNKIMTTSGGGMLLTNDAELADRVRHLATQARQPVIHYEHTEIGYNYRLSNILAALGRAQLSRLDQIMARRRQIRQAYRALFDGVRGVTVFGGEDGSDNCWLTSILVGDDAGWTPVQLMEALQREDIEARPMWKPMHLQPVFADAGRLVNGNSEWLFNHGLTLPSGSGMSDPEFDGVLQTVKSFLPDD
jgi:dTDP-4-amino-4,6-dideoxygalactose transaminase